MDDDVGIDVSLEQSSVCMVGATGRIVREAKVASKSEALAALLAGLAIPLVRVGLEAGPLSRWLHAGLTAAGYDVVLLEMRHVKAALLAMLVKTDRKDTRSIAQRLGWHRLLHSKGLPAGDADVADRAEAAAGQAARWPTCSLPGARPGSSRSDNGSEFTATAVKGWITSVRASTAFIEPGSPWENGYVESFNGKLRDELLNAEVFNTLAEAKVLIELWRWHYNTVRPHSSLGYRPPAPEVVLTTLPMLPGTPGSTGSAPPRTALH